MIFWNEVRMKNGKKFNPSEIWGNHEWKGADPSLINIVIIMIKFNLCAEKIDDIIEENRNKEEDIDWIT